MRPALAALAAILFAGVAHAQGPSVEMRTRADAVGDVYRFRSESHYAERGQDGAASQDNVQVFDLEVLAVGAEGLKLRYTLRDGSISDSGGKSMAATLRSAIGVPLEFRVSSSGALVGLDNWPDYKDRVLAAVDKALPAQDPVRSTMHERLGQAPMYAAQDMVLGDVTLLSEVEMKGQVAVGRTAAVDASHHPAWTGTQDISSGGGPCAVKFVRALAGDTPSITQTQTTDAEVSVADGRALSYSRTRTERAPGASIDERITLKRLSPAPACR